ncbi:MAG: hypothetical protein IKA63_05270, partial [Clostridia bacterium]|nr:hypothetical protein [Clostridia bacterium]
MEFWKGVLRLLDAEMERPTMYGWFHLLWFALSIAVGVILCIRFREGTEKQARKIVLITAVIVTLLEIYKQINYSFSYSGETITFAYQW